MKHIAVVSLVDEHIRREHIDHLFNEHHLDFSYFDAINKSQVADTLAKYQLSVTSERLSQGEIACFLSHYCLWQQVVEQQLPYLMVFEDDIYFSKSANFLLSNLDWLPNNFDLVKLETMYEEVILSKSVRSVLEHDVCQMQSSHMGTAGYIISQTGAKKLLTMTQGFGIDRPVDHIIFEKFIEQENSKVYQVNPALCIQDKVYNPDFSKFSSELEEERKVRECQPIIKQKLSLAKKLNRELIRLWRQLHIAERYRTLSLILKGYKNQRIDYHE